MTIKLFCNAIIKFVLGIILVGLLLFLPAGTVQYPNVLISRLFEQKNERTSQIKLINIIKQLK